MGKRCGLLGPHQGGDSRLRCMRWSGRGTICQRYNQEAFHQERLTVWPGEMPGFGS